MPHCFTPVSEEHCICGKKCGYCRNCLKLGKVRICSHLYHLKEPNAFPIPKKKFFIGKGLYLNNNKKSSNDIVQTIKKDQTHVYFGRLRVQGKQRCYMKVAYGLKNKKRWNCFTKD